MPEDSIMDMVDNIEELYNQKMAMFDRWMERGEALSEQGAHREAFSLARAFAGELQRTEMVEGRYRLDDYRQAADQMLEQFAEHREWVIQEAAKRSREPKTPAPMTPEDAEYARKMEEMSRKIGIGILQELVPRVASLERVRKALEQGDDYLNTIPLRKWDAAAAGIPYLPGQGLSLSDKVGALKHVAKWHYA